MIKQKKMVSAWAKCLLGLFLPAFLSAMLMQACSENEFPVTPVPDPFEFTPPDDVYMLAAKCADGEIVLTWDAAPEGLLKAIHVLNVRTGEQKDLPGTASEVSFTGLTNYEKYTFLVKTESQQEQLSYGVSISAKPFKHDNVAPKDVSNLLAFSIGQDLVYIVWDAAPDEDVETYRVELGSSSITVDYDVTRAVLRGNLNDPVKVTTIDYSGNESQPATAIGIEPLIEEIYGWDSGDDTASATATEHVVYKKNPKATRIDKYTFSYLNFSQEVIAPDDTYELTFPMDEGNKKNLWQDTSKKGEAGTWLVPLTLTLYEDGVVIGSYDYLTYNNVPGTLMLTHCKYISPGGQNNNGVQCSAKQNNDGKCYESVLGNIEENGWATYEINVMEDGDYEVTTWFSNGDNGKKFRLYLDDKLTDDFKIKNVDDYSYEGNEGHKTPGWDNYEPADEIITMHLTKGIHKLGFRWPGGNNFKKLVFRKKTEG